MHWDDKDIAIVALTLIAIVQTVFSDAEGARLSMAAIAGLATGRAMK